MSEDRNVFCFTWKIANFSMLPHLKGEKLSSPFFRVNLLENINWYLSIYPRGISSLDSIEYISLFLHIEPKDINLKIKYEISVLSTLPSLKVINPHETEINYKGKGYKKLLRRNDLLKSRVYLPNDTLTIKCYFQQPDNMTNYPITVNSEAESSKYYTKKCCSTLSSIQIKRRNLTWPITSISEVIKRQDQEVSIELSCALTRSPILKLSLSFEKIENTNYVQINIEQADAFFKNDKLLVKGKLSVVGASKKYHSTEEDTYIFGLNPIDVWKFPLKLKTSDLTNDKYLYLNDTLLLHCEFAYSQKDNVYHVESNHMPFCFETEKLCVRNDLSTSIENLYNSEKFCDISVHAGGETFQAYKVLLCARSSVFTAMFENEMKEKNSNTVEIPDVDPSTVKRMLAFIHTDTLEGIEHKDACKLYSAADKYDIECLKRLCVVILTSKLSVSNVCDVLRLADAHDDHFLMSAGHNFICSAANETFHSDEWEKFMDENPKLSMNIMHRFIKEQLF